MRAVVDRKLRRDMGRFMGVLVTIDDGDTGHRVTGSVQRDATHCGHARTTNIVASSVS